VTAETALTPVLSYKAARTPGLVATVGFVWYSAYVLSGFANDWSLSLFGVKAYLSTVTLILLPVALIFSGNALRGLRSSVGLCWATFLLWMILATPLSVWRGGSTALLANYVPRAYLDFFYTCAFVTTLRRCRQWMYVQIAGAVALLISCIALGSDPVESRFRIPHSLFFANSNDLALALLLGIGSFLFLFHQPSRLGRLAGIAGILLSTFYTARTGSRGCMIAASAMLILLFWLSRSRWKVAAIGLTTVGIAFAASIGGESSSTLHRLSLLTSGESPGESESDLASVASQLQREEVLKTSLRYTLRHPLLGVGPDQFATAVSQDSAGDGQHVPWLGTHNTYTQVSSECGIPALILYVAVIGACLRSNFRLYRQTRNSPTHCELAGLSRCLLASTLVFAISAFFFHMAYSPYLPSLAGFTVALQFAAPRLYYTGV
jgi:O-antigen ligase